MNTKLKRENRIRRHSRIRARVRGTASRPRLSIFKSNKHIFLQLIDDDAGRTLASAGSGEAKGKPDRVAAAEHAAKLLIDRASAAGIKTAVFDRGGYKFHGLLKAVVEQVREGGFKI